MNQDYLTDTAIRYVDHLCNTISTRRLGTQGNRDATEFFQKEIQRFGFDIESQKFDCIDSRVDDSILTIGDESFSIFASPFTLGVSTSAQMVQAGTLDELKKVDAEGLILLLHGEIAKEQLMPKDFVFYNPEEHKNIYRILEEKQPAAILTATSKNPEAAGAIYPFPMIEDGDFEIPNAYLTEVEGEKLLPFCGQQAALTIRAERLPSHGENIVARKSNQSRKIVFCAHIDTKENTPGALDNASGVSILLLLAELLSGYDGDLGVEIAAFNGEEYYNTPGQVEYLRRYQNDFSSILLAINLDDIGYFKDRTAYSFYGVPENLTEAIRSVYKGKSDFFEGPPWYQSDHGIFMAKDVPAMAITEESVVELMAEITHTEKDTPAIIDPQKLANNALALREVIAVLNDKKI